MMAGLNLRRIGFIAGLAIATFGVVMLLVAPEAMPRWWQRYWHVPQVITRGSTSELRRPAAGHNLWVGRETTKNSAIGELKFNELPTRDEAAMADVRVDSRAQYKASMAGIMGAGLILALLCLAMEYFDEGYAGRLFAHRNLSEPAPSGVASNGVSGIGERLNTDTPPFQELQDRELIYASTGNQPVASAERENRPTTSANRSFHDQNRDDQRSSDGQSGSSSTRSESTLTEEPPTSQQKVTGDSHELLIRWTDRLANGETHVHEMEVLGDQLNTVRSVGADFELSGHSLKSATLNCSFVDRDRK